MAKPPILTPQAEDFPRWYQDVIAKAELAENGPVRGTMVVRPNGYAIWERVQAEVDARIKAAGARNASFPLFIPMDYFEREKAHVEGFSPELAVVTHGGGKELEAPVAVRPTSETVIGEYMGKWVQSHRDLPLLLNQWSNVVRWEMRPRLFLRTTEFLWQEGHTAHATEADASAYARRIVHDVYESVLCEVMAIPVWVGAKTAAERFAGATRTLTCEAVMRDGKALQSATSHELGQNFAQVFDITFQDSAGEVANCWTTSWGMSMRVVGGVIMTHGDDRGLCLPPRLAPTQVVVMVVRDDAEVAEAARRLVGELVRHGVRAELDDRTETSFGKRAVGLELRGVPLRLELGPRDLADGSVTVVRRGDGSKEPHRLAGIAELVPGMLESTQAVMLAEARDRRDAITVEVDDLGGARDAAAGGVASMPWAALGETGEAELAAEGVTVRCLIDADGGVAEDPSDPGTRALVSRAY